MSWPQFPLILAKSLKDSKPHTSRKFSHINYNNEIFIKKILTVILTCRDIWMKLLIFPVYIYWNFD